MAQDTNYLILLELLDPEHDCTGTSDDDPAVMQSIYEAVKERKQYWRKFSKNPRKAAEAQTNIDRLDHAREHLDTMAKRRQAQDSGLAMLGKEANKCIRMFIDGKTEQSLNSKEIALIAQKTGTALGCTVKPQWVRALIPDAITIIEDDASSGKELPEPPADVMAKYSSTVEDLLELYQYGDLYDLLDQGNAKRASISTSEWLDKTEKAMAALPNRNSDEIAHRKQLYNLCRSTFDTDEHRARYDEYLTWKMMNGILDEVKFACQVSGKLEPAPAERYIDRLYEASTTNGTGITRDDAQAYLVSLCEKNHIVIVLPDKQQAEEKQPCPWCGRLAPSDATACSSCGGRIIVTCPECKHGNRANVHFCAQCGHDYANLTTAVSLCDEARSLAAKLRFDEADGTITQARTLWRDLPEAATVATDIARLRSLIGPLGKKLATATAERRLMAADRLYRDIMQRSPTFSDMAVRDDIDTGITMAETALNHAKQGGARTLEFLLAAYDACKDYPGLDVAFAPYTPQQPTGAVTRIDDAARGIHVSWKASGTPNATYLVVRKRGTRPMNVRDGETVGKTTDTQLLDTTSRGGETYCYAVATCLGPLTSQVANARQITALFPVSGLNASPDRSTVRLTWKDAKDGDVAVWRRTDHAPTGPGDGEPVSGVTANGALDSGLINGRRYWYGVYVRYHDPAGRVSYSRGVICDAVPSAPPEPNDFLFARLLEDGSCALEWDEPAGGRIRFLSTSGPSPWHKGDQVPESELTAKASPLSITPTGPDTGILRLPAESTIRIISATVGNGTAIIGESTIVSNRRIVDIAGISPSGTDLFVMFDWPQECDQVLLAWRTDRFPSSPDEQGCARIISNKALYDMYHAIRVANVKPDATYYFSLFARLGFGASAAYSMGSNRTFSLTPPTQANYHVEVKKTMGFGKINEAALVVNANGPLPASVLRAQRGTLPVFPTQGMQIAAIPRIARAGSYRFPVPASALVKGMQYRLFLTDESAYETATLALTPGTNPQIG